MSRCCSRGNFSLRRDRTTAARIDTVGAFVITMVHVGPVSDFVARWARAFLIAYVVGVPVIHFLAPTARKLTARFVELP